jgi:septal ring factor EnvC (AmiA/AmiB activator)
MRIADALERLATEPLESRTVVQRDTELMARMAQLERAMQKFPKQFEELTNHVRYAHRNMLSARDKQIRAQLKDRVADVKKYRLEARDLTKKVAQLEQQLAEARGSYSQE